jgi:hypothetical protein
LKIKISEVDLKRLEVEQSIARKERRKKLNFAEIVGELEESKESKEIRAREAKLTGINPKFDALLKWGLGDVENQITPEIEQVKSEGRKLFEVDMKLAKDHKERMELMENRHQELGLEIDKTFEEFDKLNEVERVLDGIEKPKTFKWTNEDAWANANRKE